MYGSEHDFILHTTLIVVSWLTFWAFCVAPLALIFLTYRLGMRHGQRLERMHPSTNAVGDPE